jgi:hypothetical protein
MTKHSLKAHPLDPDKRSLEELEERLREREKEIVDLR